MKKMICMVIGLLLCVSMALSVAAAENGFVPSITYKDGPEIEKVTLGEEKVDGCVVVTSIVQAKEKTTDITQEERDLLLELYEVLSDGTMSLPLEKGYVIRELVDVSFEHEGCCNREDHHDKDAELKKEGVTLSVDFALGVSKDAQIIAMVYIDDEWIPIENVENNGDGTVTCEFEDIGPVAFIVNESADVDAPWTGDEAGRKLGLWIGVMAVCAVGVVALIVVMNKKSK